MLVFGTPTIPLTTGGIGHNYPGSRCLNFRRVLESAQYDPADPKILGEFGRSPKNFGFLGGQNHISLILLECGEEKSEK